MNPISSFRIRASSSSFMPPTLFPLSKYVPPAWCIETPDQVHEC